MDTTIELVNGLANQFGIVQTIMLLMVMGSLGIFLYLARSTHNLALGLRSTMDKSSALTLKQEENHSATQKRMDNERQAANVRIDTLQNSVLTLSNDLARAEGRRDEMEKAHEKDRAIWDSDRKQWMTDRDEYLERISNLERDVDALKKQNAHSHERIAALETEKAHLETRVTELSALLAAARSQHAIELANRDKQLAEAVIALKQQLKECEDKQDKEPAEKTIELKQPKDKQEKSA